MDTKYTQVSRTLDLAGIVAAATLAIAFWSDGCALALANT
jgi:hypothetical protein